MLTLHHFEMEIFPIDWLTRLAGDEGLWLKSQSPGYQILKRLEGGGRFWAEKDHVLMSKKTPSINRDTLENEVSQLS